MSGRHSRYRPPSAAAAPDARGRAPTATELRPLPPVTGQFLHTVAEGERLDQLAYRYYEEPLVWWQICDANPGFLSPLALLGQEAVISVRFPIGLPAGVRLPEWQPVLRVLAAISGVELAAVQEDIEFVGNGPHVQERFSRALLVTYNRQCTGTEALIGAITAAGFTVGPPAASGQLGRPIIIPPPGRG